MTAADGPELKPTIENVQNLKKPIGKLSRICLIVLTSLA